MRYLIRHADAGDKHQWSGPDDQRPLSDTGLREAEGLIALLADFPIARIVTSPAVRCIQTMLPLADNRRLPLTTDVALAVGADVDRALGLLLAPEADGVVLCSHRELIAPLMARLRVRGAPVGDDADWPKGSVWVIEAADGAITTATYLPPSQG